MLGFTVTGGPPRCNADCLCPMSTVQISRGKDAWVSFLRGLVWGIFFGGGVLSHIFSFLLSMWVGLNLRTSVPRCLVSMHWQGIAEGGKMGRVGKDATKSLEPRLMLWLVPTRVACSFVSTSFSWKCIFFNIFSRFVWWITARPFFCSMVTYSSMLMSNVLNSVSSRTPVLCCPPSCGTSTS